jgi:2-dehydro-3-deoxygalactonokinase
MVIAASEPALIALDWGSTQLRAYLVGADGRVLHERRSDAGASRTQHGAFQAAYEALAADWLTLDLHAMACGMVGSAHGWVEAPYLACPAHPERLAGGLVVAGSGRARVHIVPGLRMDSDDRPDVMRGEETQVFGMLRLHPELAAACTLVMPGTHSKWVQVQGGTVTGFCTRMTGECFALLRQHSVLARLMAEGNPEPDAEAFARGVVAAREGGGADLLRSLFGVRALALRGSLGANAQAEYLSGLLIGTEVAAGLRDEAAGGPCVLVGEPALCARYEQAFALWHRATETVGGAATVAGLFALAGQAGLLPAAARPRT